MSESASPNRKPGNLIRNVLITLLLVAVVAGGVFIKWLSRGDAAARKTCEDFVSALNQFDFKSARALCTSAVDFEAIERQVPDMKGWGSIRSQSYTVSKKILPTGETQAEVEGAVEYQNLSKMFSGTLAQQADGSYRIAAYRLY